MTRSQHKKAQGRSTGKSCKQITGLIYDYLNESLSPKRRRDFQQHLRICPDCISFLNSYRKTVSLTGTVRAEEIPAKVQERILDFLRKRMHPSRR